MSALILPMARHRLEDELEAIAALYLALGEVDRGTRHPDGKKPESDTTHSAMLAMCAGRVAAADGLDTRQVVLFSLIHDLVEAYAGDTVTLRKLDATAQADKDAGEAKALERIREEVPWIASWIDTYERQDSAEARLVKLMDKLMPKFTHKLNGYVALREHSMSPEELEERLAGQLEYYGSDDFPVATAMFSRTSATLVARYRAWLAEHCHLHPASAAVGTISSLDADTGEDVEMPACFECLTAVGGTLGEGEDSFAVGVISNGAPCLCGPGFCASSHGCGHYGYCNGSRKKAGPDCPNCGIGQQSTEGCWSCKRRDGNDEPDSSDHNKLLLKHGIKGWEVFELQDELVNGESASIFRSYEEVLNILIERKRDSDAQ